MTVQYLIDENGNKTAVLISIKDWEKIQKKLSTQRFYDDFRESVREIKTNTDKRTRPRDISELLKELDSNN